MRQIKYLSPSGLKRFAISPEAYYLDYLADHQPPRMAQTVAMAAGSAFDAFVKAHLHSRIFGPGADPAYELDALLESQLEPHQRDWGTMHGPYIFSQYKATGALERLETMLDGASGTPRMEFELRGQVFAVRGGRLKSVTLLGRPDLAFTNKHGQFVILDFKVNSYCSKTPASPRPGYLALWSAGKTDHGHHKDHAPDTVGGITINRARAMEKVDLDWARQLCIYAWLCGEPVGSEFVIGIDQICADARGKGLPKIRVAEHRTTCGPEFQDSVFDTAVNLWDAVHSGHFFQEMSREESDATCQSLDQRYNSDGSDEVLFARMFS